MNRSLCVVALSALISLPFTSNVFANDQMIKTCEMSKRTLGKNPHCQNLASEGNSVDCSAPDALTKINAIQAKCRTQAESGAGDLNAKLADMKKGGATDSKAQELKKKIEAKRAEKAAPNHKEQGH